MTSIYGYSENSLLTEYFVKEEKLKEYTPLTKLNDYIPKKKFYRIIHLDCNLATFDVGYNNKIKNIIYEDDYVGSVFVNPQNSSTSIKLDSSNPNEKFIFSNDSTDDMLYTHHSDVTRSEINIFCVIKRNQITTGNIETIFSCYEAHQHFKSTVLGFKAGVGNVLVYSGNENGIKKEATISSDLSAKILKKHVISIHYREELVKSKIIINNETVTNVTSYKDHTFIERINLLALYNDKYNRVDDRSKINLYEFKVFKGYMTDNEITTETNELMK